MSDIQHLVMARRAEGCSNATILHELSTLNQAIKLNKKIGNPVPALSLQDIKKDNHLRPSKGRLRYLSKEEEVRLLAAFDPENRVAGFGALNTDEIYAFRRDIYDLVIVLLDTGARYSEAAGLSWTNVDLKNKTIALYRSKLKNESTLQMTSRVHEVLTRRFKNKTANHKFIFESVEGSARKYSPGGFVRACKRCGIEGITLHSLRHLRQSGGPGRLEPGGDPEPSWSRISDHVIEICTPGAEPGGVQGADGAGQIQWDARVVG
jgi:integrase